MISRLILPATLVAFFISGICNPVSAQRDNPYYWQQRVYYDMDVHLDVDTHIMEGSQNLVYHNNSPDELDRVYYHLYFNAFQPGSMMDVRARTIVDPDSRIGDRIFHLEEDEIGYQQIHSLQQNGREVEYEIDQTVMKVYLNEPILPGESAEFDMEFEAQVPKQIRRSGRDNREGIAYSMAQWYPKMAQYDREGWHTHPYVAREFHGIFGDFDVRITLDSSYTVGGTGYLQNPQEVGHGYEDPDQPLDRPEGDELTWHFYAPEVIDFMWGADDEYTHVIREMEDGPTLHFLYVDRPQTRNWDRLPRFTADAIEFLNDYIGEYPYEQFSVIQGGDGGMEYPMSTLITGHRGLFSLVNVTVHELVHMWFQTTIATNESQYAWMDEGFTVYFTDMVMKEIYELDRGAHDFTYLRYLDAAYSGLEEPSHQHSDHFRTNFGYSRATYTKGSLFLHQLEYVVGEETLKRAFQRFYEEWKFAHPDPNDFKRVVEKESGMQLGWYFDYYLETTRTIDYAIDDLSYSADQDSAIIRLAREDEGIMPIDLHVEFEDGEELLVYIPLHMMLGRKEQESPEITRLEAEPWPWTHPQYEINIPADGREIVRMEIDPTGRMADINRLNSQYPYPTDVQVMQPANIDREHYAVSWRPAGWYGENAGIRFGATAYGSYLFDQHALDVRLMLTSGTLDDYSLEQTDVDYELSYRNKLEGFGLETYWEIASKRYYGIFDTRFSLTRQLGEYGRLEPVRREISFDLFHQAQTSERLADVLQAQWQQGDIWGMELGYEFEDPEESGFEIRARAASFGELSSSGHVFARLNHTFSLRDNWDLRGGMEVGTGSLTMPNQYRWRVSQPTPEEQWNNPAHWSLAHMHSDLTTEAHLTPNRGNGLIGYALQGIGSPDIAGNNILTFTLWNTWSPFSGDYLGPATLELFAGAGRSWSGNFIDDLPVLGDTGTALLTSAGAGLSYRLADLPLLSDWRPQSRFIDGLELSIRMPLYLRETDLEDEFTPYLLFGVSESF